MQLVMKVRKRGYMMTNLEKYNQAFMNAFEITQHMLDSKLEYQSIQNWDSVGHMGLIAELEEAFEIMFETEDIIDFSSYEKGKEIIAKYEVII